MNIVHVTSHLDVGGVTSYVLALSRGLSVRGHSVTVVSGGGQMASGLANQGVAHRQAPLHTSAEFGLSVWRAKRQLVRQLRGQRVDILHAHTRVGQVVAAYLSRKLRIPYVTTWHGVFHQNLGRWLWPCTGDLTIAISRSVQQHLRDYFHVPQDKIRLVHNGVDTRYFSVRPEASTLQAYRAQWNIAEGKPTIGSIGRFASGGVKGFDLLLAAVAELGNDFPDLQVVLVGDGPRRPFIEAKARQLGIDRMLRLVGTVADTRMPLALMDVFVFASRQQEGFGLALVEAMAAGKPVVATRVGAAPEIIEEGQSGLLAEPENPSAIAQNVAQLLRKSDVAAQLASAAQARAFNYFSLDHFVKNVESVYNELVV